MNFFDIKSRITNLVKVVEYADKKIKTEIKKHPESAKDIWATFLACKPPDMILHCDDVVWQAHINEIVERGINHGDLSIMTEPEILLVLRETSMRFPLKMELAEVASHLMDKLGYPNFESVFNENGKEYINSTLQELLSRRFVKRGYDYSNDR